MEALIPVLLDLVDDVVFAMMALMPSQQYYMALFGNLLSKLYK